jgi:hypothetical protein
MENSVQPLLALGFVATPAEMELLHHTSLEFHQLLYAVLIAHTLIFISPCW